MKQNQIHWKRRILVGCFLIAACVVTIAWNRPAQAEPLDIEPGSKLVYKFNVIGYPAGKEYQGGCGQGRRIFVNRDAHHAHILLTDTDDGWWIEDCNATRDKRAILHTDEAGIYDVYVRILGKPGGSFFVCADTEEDHETGEHLCLLGTIDLTRAKGKSKFAIQPSALFDAELENIVWSVDTNKDFRIVQFRIYKVD